MSKKKCDSDYYRFVRNPAKIMKKIGFWLDF